MSLNNHIKFLKNQQDPPSFSNIKQLINNYNWEGINYPWNIRDWKIREKNKLAITLNSFYIKLIQIVKNK